MTDTVSSSDKQGESATEEAEIVKTEPITPAPEVSDKPPRKWWQIWRAKPKKLKRPLLLRLFGIGIWGTIKLITLCILVGFVVLTTQFDPTAPDFKLGSALWAFAGNTLAAAKWTVTNFWSPAIAGAIIVLPAWVLWRLISLPFRR